MKVIFLFGGLPHYAIHILNKINEVAHLEVIVIIPATKSNTIGQGVFETDKEILFKVYHLPEYKTLYGKPFFKGLGKILKQEKPQVLVAGWPYILGIAFNFYYLILLKRLHIKLIYRDIPYKLPFYQEAVAYYQSGKGFVDETLENTQNIPTHSLGFKLKYKFLTWVRKYYFNLVAAHVTYTEAHDILGSYGVPKEKIFTTYNSPDTDIIFKAKAKILQEAPILPYNPYRILHIGRLVKWKKVHLLIDAFNFLKKDFSQAELIVIGTGPELENLKIQAANLSLEKSIRFLGGIYEIEELGKYLLASGVYVLAGVGGLSINEAMCFNKPIICSECDGTEKHLVKEGYNGYFFENDNTQDLYEKLKLLLSNLDKMKEMGENSEKIIKEEINIYTVVKGFVAAFNFVTQNKYNIKA